MMGICGDVPGPAGSWCGATGEWGQLGTVSNNWGAGWGYGSAGHWHGDSDSRERPPLPLPPPCPTTPYSGAMTVIKRNDVDRHGLPHSERDDRKSRYEVYVANLPEDIKVCDLKEVFGKCGKVRHVKMLHKNIVNGCMSAFVGFDTCEEAELAIASLNEKYEIRYGYGSIEVKWPRSAISKSKLSMHRASPYGGA